MFIIDRFEGEMAVIEWNRKLFKIPRNLLPPEAGEGDIIKIQITIEKTRTSQRKKKLNNIFNELLKY